MGEIRRIYEQHYWETWLKIQRERQAELEQREAKLDIERAYLKAKQKQREIEERYGIKPEQRSEEFEAKHPRDKKGKFTVKTDGQDLTDSRESDIINAITIKDFEVVDTNGTISDDCRETIIKVLKEQGVSSVYDGIRIFNKPPDKDGRIDVLITNVVYAPGYPKVYLEINEAFFAERDKNKIDDIFNSQNYSVADSLEEAVIHECGHAKVIRSKSYYEYEAINDELKGDIFTRPIASREDKKSLKDLAGTISEYARKDGLECIAESNVKLHRGETIPDELQALYDKYIK